MNAPDELFIPPHSVEAEQSVIGAVLTAGSNAFDRLEGLLTERDFYSADHRRIFAAICAVANKNKAVDAITVADELNRMGNLDAIGGLQYLGELAQSVPSAANIVHYAKIVRDRALQRSLLIIAEEIKSACAVPGADIGEIVGRTDAAMVQLLDRESSEPSSLADCMVETISEIDDLASGHKQSGLRTGSAGLDEYICGLEPGQLVIIGARPSVGKTAFAVNLADYIAGQGHAIAFFSLEMSRKQITQRLIALRSGVSVQAMRSGQLAEDEWSRISACQSATHEQKLFIIDRGAIGVPYVRAAARKIKRQHGLNLIVIDYIGLLLGTGQNRTQEIGGISIGLKALAKELQVPIIALAQLNRANESRTDKRPQLSDLRDSGQLEADGDIVAMLHREELHNNSAELAGMAELIIRKNRNGAIGTTHLRFEAELMRFTHCSPPIPSPQSSGYSRRGMTTSNYRGME